MKRRNQKIEDRLSDLPDSIILHILSFLNTKPALRTVILSTRWKNIPKYLPILRLCSSHFKSLQSFDNFLSRIFTLRDHSTALHTLNFNGGMECNFLKSIVEYAISHNVRSLRISLKYEIPRISSCLCSSLRISKIPLIPSCLFSSQTLTSLDLSVPELFWSRVRAILCPSAWNLPALTRLTLEHFFFDSGDDGCVEPFSALNKLNTLTIKNCMLINTQILCISSTTLVNLTIDGDNNLRYEYKISTPSLCNFSFTGAPCQKLCVSHPRSIKRVYIGLKNLTGEINNQTRQHSKVLFSWLQELPSIELLKVSFYTLKVFSFDADLFKAKLASLRNLDTLQIETKRRGQIETIWRYVKFKKEGDKFYSKEEDLLIPDGLEDVLIPNSLLVKLKCALNYLKRFCFRRTKSTQG